MVEFVDRGRRLSGCSGGWVGGGAVRNQSAALARAKRTKRMNAGNRGSRSVQRVSAMPRRAKLDLDRYNGGGGCRCRCITRNYVAGIAGFRRTVHDDAIT
jgi:hypothetical protein